MHQSIYEPSEDSLLLQKQVKRLAQGDVLDIGCGSGILSFAAKINKKVKTILGVDINKKAVDHCNKQYPDVRFRQSNLFDKIKEEYDTIIFNPPYLPDDKSYDIALHGGKNGYETIERFLKKANNHLKEKGIILLLFSSFSKKNKIDEIISLNLFKTEQLDKKHIFFEDLFVYKLTKSDILKKINKLKIRKIEYIAKGKRGFVFKGILKNKDVIIKIKNPKSTAIERIRNEGNYLKILNKKSIGPRLFYYDSDVLITEFIKGKEIVDYLNSANKKQIIQVITDIFKQCFIMDKLNVDKFEMTRPLKHIIIDKKPVQIDFERCKRSIKPRNVTQFVQFLFSGHLKKILKEKRININKQYMLEKAKEYKKNINRSNYDNIIKEIK